MSAADDIAALESALALERGRVRQLVAERERVMTEPYDGYYRRSELEALKTEAARVERERCKAEQAAAVVNNFMVVVDKLRTELAAERERLREIIDAAAERLDYLGAPDDAADLRAAIRSK